MTARKFVQKELGLPDETRFIGQISVLRSWKGHETLIDAFNIFADSFPNYHLLIVGDGPRYKHLNSYVKKKDAFNKIHFLGLKITLYHTLLPWSSVCWQVFKMKVFRNL